MIKPVKIGSRYLSTNSNCYIIAEIGSNFNGRISNAKKLIKLAKNSGEKNGISGKMEKICVGCI